jgi:four helix bundle protein
MESEKNGPKSLGAGAKSGGKTTAKEEERSVLKKQTKDLLKYTYRSITRLPKVERFALTEAIKRATLSLHVAAIKTASYYNRDRRFEILSEAYADYALLEDLVDLAYDNRYITARVHETWVRKVVNIGNIIVGWAQKCQRKMQKQEVLGRGVMGGRGE